VFADPTDDRGYLEYSITAPTTDAAREWDGYGTALKPAFEPILLARKPRDATYAQTAVEHGSGALWIDGGRVGIGGDRESGGLAKRNSMFQSGKQVARPTGGRWPAHLVLDDEAGDALDRQSGESVSSGGRGHKSHGMFLGDFVCNGQNAGGLGDTGGASRFFAHCNWADEDWEAQRMIYTAKASRSERNAGCEDLAYEWVPGEEPKGNRSGETQTHEGPDGPVRRGQTTPNRGNTHPTVKAIALMRYLCRLTKTPTGGVVLDPFAGSGSTGCAAVKEGRDFIGIERNAEYCEIARRRIEHWAMQPTLEGM